MKIKIYAVVAILATVAGAFLIFASDSGGSALVMKLEGSWVGRTNYGVQFALTYAPSHPSGRSAAYYNQVVSVPPAVYFPGMDSFSAEVGESFMTGNDKADFTAVGYGLNAGEIVYIFVDSGTISFSSPTRATLSMGYSVFTADADADGDGLPDPGSTPIFCLPLTGTATRVQLMPPCK